MQRPSLTGVGLKRARSAGHPERMMIWSALMGNHETLVGSGQGVTSRNSLYGALLNVAFRFGDPRFGQSVTLSGRVVTKHMARQASELLGEGYTISEKIIAGDTDSVVGGTLISTPDGQATIENLFADGKPFAFSTDGKERAHTTERVMTVDCGKRTYKIPDHIYRHKVSKERWLVKGKGVHAITMTGDHSVMVYRNGEMIGVKPSEIIEGDKLVVPRI